VEEVVRDEREALFTDAERDQVEALRAKSAAAWDARRQAFVGCSINGHEDRTATHRARWTVYGGASQSRVLCEECASTALARGQRGLVIETLPSFRGVGQ
jgi:hypothetical protein